MPLLLLKKKKYFYCCNARKDGWAASSKAVQRREQLRQAPPHCRPEGPLPARPLPARPLPAAWQSIRDLSLCPVLPLLSGSLLSLTRSGFVTSFLQAAVELVSQILLLATTSRRDSFRQQCPAVES